MISFGDFGKPKNTKYRLKKNKKGGGNRLESIDGMIRLALIFPALKPCCAGA